MGGGKWSTKCTIPEFQEIFTGIDLFSIIYVRYCRSELGKGTVKLVVK